MTEAAKEGGVPIRAAGCVRGTSRRGLGQQRLDHPLLEQNERVGQAVVALGPARVAGLHVQLDGVKASDSGG